MEHISLLIVIENDPLQRDSLLFEVVRGQRHTVDRAESRVRDHQTPKTAGFDYLRQTDIRLIKAERAEDSTASLHRHVLVLLTDLLKSRQHSLHLDRISLDP